MQKKIPTKQERTKAFKEMVAIVRENKKLEEKYKGQTKRIWYQKGYQDAVGALKIGYLRQWINEKPANHLVTDEDIKIMLGIESGEEKKHLYGSTAENGSVNVNLIKKKKKTGFEKYLEKKFKENPSLKEKVEKAKKELERKIEGKDKSE